MQLLVLTDRPEGALGLLPSLEFLDHAVETEPLAEPGPASLDRADVVVVDATDDLRTGASTCRAVTVAELERPVVVVVEQGGLAALKVTWGFEDWVLPSSGPVELETRLRIVRDRAAIRDSGRTAAVGDLVVDEESYQVRLRGQPLDLTFKEFELLKALASSPNRVFTRELLLSDVWGYDYYGGSRTVDVHIRRLRAKLGPEYDSMIVTVRGVGYKLVPQGRRGDDRD